MKITFQILILSLFFSTLFTNDIDSIKISGNLKTKDSTILNTINKSIDSLSINKQKNIDELIKLNIFDDVTINYNDNIYHITVKEKKTISYAPLIDKVDGLGWSFGSHVYINNIRGSLSHIDLSIGFGSINSQKIKYKKNNLVVGYSNKILNSIESNYINQESLLDISYTINKNLELNLGKSRNHLNYNSQYHAKFDYLNTAILYNKSKNNFFVNSFLKYNISNKSSDENYFKLFFKLDKHLYIENNNIKSKVLFRSQIVLNTYNENLSLDFENLYLGGDDFVRSYNPDPNNNPDEVVDNLKFRNMLFQSIQFEFPILKNEFFTSKFLLFNDFAVGSNNYKYFNKKNKIKGYGFGISLITMYDMRFDICIGLNKFGSNQIHFMKNINF